MSSSHAQPAIPGTTVSTPQNGIIPQLPEQPQELYNLLSSPLMPHPPFYNKTKSLSPVQFSSYLPMMETKDLTNDNINVKPEDRLLQIVFAPSMLEDVIETATSELEGQSVQSGAEKIIHPIYTAMALPAAVYSEGDIADLCSSCMLRPALLTLRDRLGINPIITGNLDRTHSAIDKFPYIASAPKTAVIADHRLIDLIDQRLKTVVAVEYKSNNAIYNWQQRVHVATAISVVKDIEDTILAQLQVLSELPNTSAEAAVKFIWPKDVAANKNDTLTRILVQIWSEMVEEETNYSIFSTYHSTIFFKRDKNTLFLSQTYTANGQGNEAAILATYSFLRNALDVARNPGSKCLLRIPEVDFSHWKSEDILDAENHLDCFGIVPKSLPRGKTGLLPPNATKRVTRSSSRKPEGQAA